MMVSLYLFCLVAVLSMVSSAPPTQNADEHKSHTYEFNIHESGTDFTERVTIDEDRNLEIIEVPSHNDVTGATYIHDFNLNVTLRREVGDGRCFLTDLSHDIEVGLQPTPRDMLAAINSPKAQSGGSPRTVAFKWTVGAAVTEEERAAFGAEMRELCDGQIIHRLDRVDDSVTVHEASSGLMLHRARRQVVDGEQTGCVEDLVASRCIVQLKNCRYTRVVNCDRFAMRTSSRMVVNCLNPTFAHIYDRIICCMDCCSVASVFMPECSTLTESRIREEVVC